MQDKDIFTALINILHQGYKEHGYTNITLLRAFQPSPQGRLKQTHVTLVKLFDKNIGQPQKTYIYQQIGDNFLHRYLQYIETTLEISAFVNQMVQQDFTAADLCNLSCHILKSDRALEHLGEIGLRPMRFSPIKNPHFDNLKASYQANPSFELVVSHYFKQETICPAAKIIKGNFA